MNSELQKQISELEALDAKRLEGNWFTNWDDNGFYAIIAESKMFPLVALVDDDDREEDAKFIAAAPRMMSVIRQLVARQDKIIQAADKMRDAILSDYLNGARHSLLLTKAHDDYNKLVTTYDAVKG